MNTLAELFNQHNKVLVTVAQILLVVLMSLSLANAALFFIETANQAEFSSDNGQAQSNQGAAAKKSFRLSELNLFGSLEQVITPEVVDAPKTSLNLELKGVITADDPAASTAIVAQKGKSGELFSIGDRLPGNAILNAVFDDHILIKRGTRIEKLQFAESLAAQQLVSDPAPSTAISRPRIQQQTSSRLQQVRERISQRSEEISQKRTNNQVADSDLSKSISEYKARLDTDPDAVLAELGMAPMSTSKASGYKISNQISQTGLRQAGLKQGDVILSVNGQPVGNIANDRSMIDQVVAAKRVRVEVQRDTRRFFVTIPIPR